MTVSAARPARRVRSRARSASDWLTSTRTPVSASTGDACGRSSNAIRNRSCGARGAAACCTSTVMSRSSTTTRWGLAHRSCTEAWSISCSPLWLIEAERRGSMICSGAASAATPRRVGRSVGRQQRHEHQAEQRGMRPAGELEGLGVGLGDAAIGRRARSRQSASRRAARADRVRRCARLRCCSPAERTARRVGTTSPTAPAINRKPGEHGDDDRDRGCPLVAGEVQPRPSQIETRSAPK